jgi:hypothetical protein
MSDKPENWPPKFTVTPEGAAGLFLTAHCPTCNARVAVEALTELLKIHWQSGYDAAKQEQEPNP